MHVNRGLRAFGVFLLALGIVALAMSQGYLDGDLARATIQLWPLLMVAVGVAIAAGHSALGTLAGVVAAATLGVMVGAVGGTGVGMPFGGCGGDQATTAFHAQAGELGREGIIDLEFNCGNLAITSAEGPAWRLEGSSHDGAPPRAESGADRVRLRPAGERTWLGFGSGRNDWALTVPTTPLDLVVAMNGGRADVTTDAASIRRLELTANAADVRVDLARTAALGSVNLSANAGAVRLSLPGRSLTADLSGNAASLTVCTPTDVGIRITMEDNITAVNNFAAAGLTRSGTSWQTVDLAESRETITIDVQANAGQLVLDRSGRCGD